MTDQFYRSIGWCFTNKALTEQFVFTLAVLLLTFWTERNDQRHAVQDVVIIAKLHNYKLHYSQTTM